MAGSSPPVGDIFTVGHSTHDLAAFVALLHRHDIQHVVDVRTVPRSRRLPQFNAGALEGALRAERLQYSWVPDLGGLRKPVAGSVNDGWTDEGFRGYADHMATQRFAEGLGRLTEIGASRPSTVLCAEGDWRRCHRQLLADALVLGGWRVRHILPDGRLEPHQVTSFAVVTGVAGADRVTYPPAQGSLLGDPRG